MADRGDDAYFSPPEAVSALLAIEAAHMPASVWEPAAGAGAIVKPLRQSGRTVIASDIRDYGLEACEAPINYLEAAPRAIEGIVTNPPYRLAAEFVEKATEEAPYVAMLLRTNFLESTRRKSLFERKPPARVWVASRRLPMMHRLGWAGPQAPSNTCFAWFVWDARSGEQAHLRWFDWKEHVHA